MPRPPLSYDQVAAVANTLAAQGIVNPSAKQVRDELTRRAGPGASVGSPNTIQRHLEAWRAQARPAGPALVTALPEPLANELLSALNAAAGYGQSLMEEKLQVARAEIAELTTAGEALDAKVAELTDTLAERTSERDTMAGQLAVRTSEWEEAKAKLEAATQRAVEAEKGAAAAAAHLEGERSARAGLQAQVAQMQQRLQQLEADAARAAAAEATAAGLREQLALLGSTNAMLRTLVPKGAEG